MDVKSEREVGRAKIIHVLTPYRAADNSKGVARENRRHAFRRPLVGQGS